MGQTQSCGGIQAPAPSGRQMKPNIRFKPPILGIGALGLGPCLGSGSRVFCLGSPAWPCFAAFLGGDDRVVRQRFLPYRRGGCFVSTLAVPHDDQLGWVPMLSRCTLRSHFSQGARRGESRPPPSVPMTESYYAAPFCFTLLDFLCEKFH